MTQQRARACIYCLCLLLLATSYCLQGREFSLASVNASSVKPLDSLSTVSKSPTGAMLRSLIFPGWGQYYNQKPFKALLIGGVEMGLVVNIALQNRWAQRAPAGYEREFYINNRNLAIWYLAGLILYSMADAYVDAHLFDFDESPELSLTPAVLSISQTKQVMVGLNIAWSF